MNDIAIRRHKVDIQPKVPLTAENVAGSSIIESRLAMLDALPNGMRCLELGVAEGDFSQELLKRLAPRTLSLVDLWSGERYEPGFSKVKNIFKDDIEGGVVSIHKNNSLDFLNSSEIASFDFVYIDTDHTYQTTYKELCAAMRIISEGGYICGHDFTVGNIITPVVYGVIEAVCKFCVEYKWKIKYLTAEPKGWNSFCLERI